VNVDAGATETPKGAGMGVMIGAIAGAVVGVGLFEAFSVPVLVSIIAAGVGAYIGSLIGAMSHTRKGEAVGHPAIYHHEERDSGVLLAVHVSPDSQMEAARLLREAGGNTIERATGRWQQGRWSDFDPTKTPVPIEQFSERHA
jgi:hypothetical protein